MSRRCPKRNHLFLNWLKANRSRFPFEPQIDKIKGRHIHGRFAGVSAAIRFSVNKGGLVVGAHWKGECLDLIGDFDVAERQTDQGYYSAFILPDWITYYPTREALFTQESFEPFLKWCNEKLATNQWLALYEYHDGGCTEAKLQKYDNVKESPALQELLRGLKPLGESQSSPKVEKDVTQNIVQMIPLFKSGLSSHGVDNKTH